MFAVLLQRSVYALWTRHSINRLDLPW